MDNKSQFIIGFCILVAHIILRVWLLIDDITLIDTGRAWFYTFILWIVLIAIYKILRFANIIKGGRSLAALMITMSFGIHIIYFVDQLGGNITKDMHVKLISSSNQSNGKGAKYSAYIQHWETGKPEYIITNKDIYNSLLVSSRLILTLKQGLLDLDSISNIKAAPIRMNH